MEKISFFAKVFGVDRTLYLIKKFGVNKVIEVCSDTLPEVENLTIIDSDEVEEYFRKNKVDMITINKIPSVFGEEYMAAVINKYSKPLMPVAPVVRAPLRSDITPREEEETNMDWEMNEDFRRKTTEEEEEEEDEEEEDPFSGDADSPDNY